MMCYGFTPLLADHFDEDGYFDTAIQLLDTPYSTAML